VIRARSSGGWPFRGRALCAKRSRVWADGWTSYSFFDPEARTQSTQTQGRKRSESDTQPIRSFSSGAINTFHHATLTHPRRATKTSQPCRTTKRATAKIARRIANSRRLNSAPMLASILASEGHTLRPLTAPSFSKKRARSRRCPCRCRAASLSIDVDCPLFACASSKAGLPRLSAVGTAANG
jgi:hypothetical protein